jgi:hypothetical protein
MAIDHATHAAAPPRDRGDVILTTTVFVAFLMFGAWALVSAGQQWGARRDAQASAAAAARAGAQVQPGTFAAAPCRSTLPLLGPARTRCSAHRAMQARCPSTD